MLQAQGTLTWAPGLWTAAFDWALSASPASILEKNKYFLKIALKLAIYAAPGKEDSSGVPHSLLTLTGLHFRDHSISCTASVFSTFIKKGLLLTSVTPHCALLQIWGSSNEVETWENNDYCILCRCYHCLKLVSTYCWMLFMSYK